MRLVDYYGNIPYTEALRAIDGIFYPAYNTGQEIYADILNELEASRCCNQRSPIRMMDFASADMYFKGNVDQVEKMGKLAYAASCNENVNRRRCWCCRCMSTKHFQVLA